MRLKTSDHPSLSFSHCKQGKGRPPGPAAIGCCEMRVGTYQVDQSPERALSGEVHCAGSPLASPPVPKMIQTTACSTQQID